jgi:hypothetical protein
MTPRMKFFTLVTSFVQEELLSKSRADRILKAYDDSVSELLQTPPTPTFPDAKFLVGQVVATVGKVRNYYRIQEEQKYFACNHETGVVSLYRKYRIDGTSTWHNECNFEELTTSEIGGCSR